MLHDSMELDLSPCGSKMIMQADSQQHCLMNELNVSVYNVMCPPFGSFLITEYEHKTHKN